MAKDNAIRDQKVFVRLGAVLELQKMYSEMSDKYGCAVNAAAATPTANNKAGVDRLRTYKQALERVIKTLELPIDLPIGV